MRISESPPPTWSTGVPGPGPRPVPWAIWCGPPVVALAPGPPDPRTGLRSPVARVFHIGPGDRPALPPGVLPRLAGMIGAPGTTMFLHETSPSRAASPPRHVHIFDESRPGWWFGLLLPDSGQFWEATEIPETGDPEVAWMALPGAWCRVPTGRDAEMAARIIGDHIREGDALAAGLAPPSAG